MKKLLITAALCSLTVMAVGCGEDRKVDHDGTSHFSEFDYGNGEIATEGNSRHNDTTRHDESSRYDDTTRHDDNIIQDETNDVRDRVDDAVDGVEDAGEDIVSGAGDAVSDIVDGFRRD